MKQETKMSGWVEATPLVDHVLVQYWRCDFERKTKDEGDEEVGGFREKESRCSHRGRISSVAFVAEESSESFVDDQSLWLSSTEEIVGSPLQTNSSVGANVRYSPSSSSLTWQVRTTEFEKKKERTDSGLFWRGAMAELHHSSSWKPCTEGRIGGVSGILDSKIKNAALILLVLKKDQIVKQTLETIKRVSPRRALLMGMAQAFGHHKPFSGLGFVLSRVYQTF
ncbi:unnamed protein product [Brassica oleracea var. botrytis]|uniref:Uncharacterized protein n=1 Tax=Brassica oleracea TaxID=3712 RepID=A0A3P6DPI3_BRAOL|nr:unnamed protein product [Brassica oleracea]